MRILLDQIERALQANLYFVALMAALSIPDIAGAIDSTKGEATRKSYIDWYEKYVRPISREQRIAELSEGRSPEERQRYEEIIKPSPITGDACYRFRCSLLHQGSTVHPKSPFKRIAFVVPGSTPHFFHNNITNDNLLIDLPTFCRDIIKGANRWLAEKQETEQFKKNYERFARVYPEGLAPMLKGLPVIA